MRIHLLSYTHLPLHAIGAAALSIGTGRGVTDLLQISMEEAEAAFRDTCRTKLDSNLEFASFVFFWEDVPIFLLRELIRHRVGCSYAEQSLRFAIVDNGIIDRFPLEYVPDMLERAHKGDPAPLGIYQDIVQVQVTAYQSLLRMGVPAQEARNVLGVWVPTHITTAFTYRALRDILALRQTNQAHPAWRDAVAQIKALVAGVHPALADELKDICAITGRCVWWSKLDRPCSACAARGLDPNHQHAFTKFLDGFQYCACGERERWTASPNT